jgi:hypothetical protein
MPIDFAELDPLFLGIWLDETPLSGREPQENYEFKTFSVLGIYKNSKNHLLDIRDL